ncbi:hypothetical protein DMENIID0001_127000 [Sergentomyia squamirostris]
MLQTSDKRRPPIPAKPTNIPPPPATRRPPQASVSHVDGSYANTPSQSSQSSSRKPQIAGQTSSSATSGPLHLHQHRLIHQLSEEVKQHCRIIQDKHLVERRKPQQNVSTTSLQCRL